MRRQKSPHVFFRERLTKMQISGPILMLFFALQIIKLAVYGMLPKNLTRRTMMQRLHLFPDDVSSQLIL